jgi:hypothetical protein
MLQQLVHLVCSVGIVLIFAAVKEYVKGLENADELLDMISAAIENQEAKAAGGEMLYPEVCIYLQGWKCWC